jgi:hypothetical protein
MIAREKTKAAKIGEGLSDWILLFEREPKEGACRQFLWDKVPQVGYGLLRYDRICSLVLCFSS